MGITFGPNSEKPELPSVPLGPQVASLVSKMGDLTFRMESIEYKFKQLYLITNEIASRLRGLEQHLQWEDSSFTPSKKPRRKKASKK